MPKPKSKRPPKTLGFVHLQTWWAARASSARALDPVTAARAPSTRRWDPSETSKSCQAQHRLRSISGEKTVWINRGNRAKKSINCIKWSTSKPQRPPKPPPNPTKTPTLKTCSTSGPKSAQRLNLKTSNYETIAIFLPNSVQTKSQTKKRWLSAV